MTSREYHNQLMAAYHTQFSIPDYLTEGLEIYKRLNWSASYFIAQWESSRGTYAAGTIRRYNHIFHVNFSQECNIGKIKSQLEADPNTQLILSFRKLPKQPAYVIVDFLRGEAK